MARARRAAGWLPLLAALLASAACGAAEDKPGLLELTAGMIIWSARPGTPDHPPGVCFKPPPPPPPTCCFNCTPPAADSFTPTLQGLDDSRWVLMEFYAHWCVLAA